MLLTLKELMFRANGHWAINRSLALLLGPRLFYGIENTKQMPYLQGIDQH